VVGSLEGVKIKLFIRLFSYCVWGGEGGKVQAAEGLLSGRPFRRSRNLEGHNACLVFVGGL
jgi:hypothetical protein